MADLSILRALSDIVEPRNPNDQIKFQHLYLKFVSLSLDFHKHWIVKQH